MAAGYAVVRVGSALAVVAAQELGRAAMLHRLLGVALAAAIAVVFERLARTLGRAEA